MTSPRFEYDGRTDEPHPPLRNVTPLLLLMGLGGALVLGLLVAGGLLALYRATRSPDPATEKVGHAKPFTIWDGTVAGDRPVGRGPVPDRPDRWGDQTGGFGRRPGRGGPPAIVAEDRPGPEVVAARHVTRPTGAAAGGR